MIQKYSSRQLADKKLGVNSILTVNTLERTPNADTLQNKSEKEGLSIGTKIALGTVVILGTAVLIDQLAFKGKCCKKIFDLLKKETNLNTSVIGTTSAPKMPNFFEQKGLKINKEIVSNADGTLYTGTLVKINKNGEKYILNYKDGVLQTSDKYTKTEDFVLRKKYTQEIDNRFDTDRQPYQVKNRRMYLYNKDGKIINGVAVLKNKNSTFYISNKYSIYKDASRIIQTRFASKDGQPYNLFDKPYEKESDARARLGMACLEALQSPLKKNL